MKTNTLPDNAALQDDRQQAIKTVLTDLCQRACRLGASEAAPISTSDIRIEEKLAKLCEKPGCENYGQSASCPPHVAGPDGFRKRLTGFGHAIVFKIDVPTEILLSNQRLEIFQLLHEIAADIEQTAVKSGWPRAKAFAGGSCKRLFCDDQPNCRVVAKGGACRNPDRARPSMSGFGINVHKLMQAAGWSMEKITGDTDPADVSMGTVTGLVLIC